MKAVFGLGNPGAKYALTRHNVGFDVIDLVRKRQRLRRPGRIRHRCILYRHGELLLAKPTTFMNASGEAVAAVVRGHKIPLEEILVVYDDLDLESGRIKILAGGGPGTHKGMQSIVEELGTDRVPRLKIGVDVAGRQLPGEAFVLRSMTPGEWETLVPALDRAAEAVEAFRERDIHALMTEFNRRSDAGC